MEFSFLDSESDEEEFEGFPCEPNLARKTKLVNKALESSEEEDDDSDDFKGSITSSGRKRKALEAFESDDDYSESDEDDASSNDEDDEDDDEDGSDNGDEDGIETEDTLEMELNENDDDIPSNSDQCPICLMSLGGQKLGTPSECQHVFCLACIMEWSKNANTCPVDRKVFHEILVHSTKKGPILERIPVEDRRVPEIGWEQEPTFCEVCNECNREDRMLLCDGCDKGYHLECLRPRLYTVPAGSWYCTTCIEIRRNEEMEEQGGSVPELLPGSIRRSRGTARASTRSEASSGTSEPDGPQRARTAATNRRRSSSTRGRGRGRGRTGSRSSGRGRSRSRTTGRSRTGSSTRRGRGGKKKTRKRTSTTTGKPRRKKRKTTTTKKKRRSTTKSKAKKRKVDKDDSYRNPFEGQSFRGRTPRERLNTSLRASGSTSDAGRGLGMSSGLSIFGDHYALNGFEDESTNEPEQSDSSSVKSANSDVLGSIFDGIETLHDQNATVSRDGRVRPSESTDKKSPCKGSQIKTIDSSTNQNSGDLSRETSDVISPPRDLKQRESEKPGNKSRDEALIAHNDGHVTSLKSNESHQSDDRSRDNASLTSQSRDQTGHKPEASMNPSLVKVEKEKTKRNENCQTGLQNISSTSNKMAVKDSASTEQVEVASLENKSFKSNSRINSAAIPNHHKISPESKLKSGESSKHSSPALEHSSSSVSSCKRSMEQPTPSASETYQKSKYSSKPLSPKVAYSSSSSFTSKRSLEYPTPSASETYQKSKYSSKPPSPKVAYSSSSSFTSKRSLEYPTPSACETHVRFRIPKKSSHALDTSSSQKSSPGTLPSKSYSPGDSNVSRSTGIPGGSESKPAASPTKDTPPYKKVSPILWTDRDSERNNLPEFKVNDITCRTKPTTVRPKARLPQTPSIVPANKELNSSGDKKINFSSESKNDFDSSARSFKEKHKSNSKRDEAKSDLGNVNEYSHRSAFSPVIKIKEEKSSKISDAKQEEMKIFPKTELREETSRLGNQSPSFYNKPSLQQLPTSLRSPSPLSKIYGPLPSTGLTGFTSTSSPGKAQKQRIHSPLSKVLGPRPSTSKTGSASTSLSGKREKQSSPGQDARVIEFSKEKGELKIKVVPTRDETHSSLRILREETHSALRSLPEEAHPALRSLPEEAHPALRSLPEDAHPALRSLPEEAHPALRSLPEEAHPALRSLPEEAHPALRSLPEEAYPALRSLPPPSSGDPHLPPLYTLQPLSSLKPLKPVRQPPRPKLKMLSTFETSPQPAGTLSSGIQPSCDVPNRTNQNLAIIQMLRHKTSSLRSEVEKGHSLLREELAATRRGTPEIEPDSLSRSSSSSCSSARPPLEDSLDRHENNINRPKLSSLLGSPRNSNLPVAVVRPSLSSAAAVNRNLNPDPCYRHGPQSMESEREKNRKKGIARLQRLERIKSVVKASLQPYYEHSEITRQDFKEIFIRAVDKVKDSSHEVERQRIASLVKKYVKMFKGLRLIETNHDSDL